MARDPITWNSLTPYEKFKDVLTIISGLSVLTLIFINLYSIKNILSPPKIYDSDVVIKYMDEYSDKVGPDVTAYNQTCRDGNCYNRVDTLMKNYFALSEQELFYIKNNVISPEVTDEWLTSMLRQMQKFSDEDDYKKTLLGFGRVRTTFDFNLDTLQQPMDSGSTLVPISEEQVNICKKRLDSYNSNNKMTPNMFGNVSKDKKEHWYSCFSFLF